MDFFINVGVPIIVSVALLAAIALLSYKNKPMTTKEIALCAVTVAMSYGLSYLKLHEMPQGGSITPASLLPVMLFAYIFGFRKGLMTGMIYGWLQFIQSPWFVHPLQVILDYLLGFMSIALAGVFKSMNSLKRRHMYDLLAGIVLAGTFRYLCSIISGVVFFAEYAGDMNVWIYSLGYNSVLMIDTAIAFGVCIFLQFSPHFKKLARYLDDGKNFGAVRRAKKKAAAAGAIEMPEPLPAKPEPAEGKGV